MNINEIAKLAGVSRATVSRYLNNGYVSEEKKDRIKQVIDETGYIPSAYAQTLRSKHSRTIGVIIPKLNSDSISCMVDGISKRLKEDNYHLLLACTNNDEKEELRSLDLFKENQVDGIILLGTIFTPAHKKICDKLSVPLVILGQNIPGYSCIYSDEYNAAYALGEKIAEKAKKVGMITVTEKDIAVGINRRDGFLTSLKDKGIEVDKDCIIKTEFNIGYGYAACKELLEKHPDIDTLICATDTIAFGALQYLHQSPRRIPEDIQVTGFGDSKLSVVTTPTLSTVHFYYENAGSKAADILLEKISASTDNSEAQVSLCLNYRIVERESTR